MPIAVIPVRLTPGWFIPTMHHMPPLSSGCSVGVRAAQRLLPLGIAMAAACIGEPRLPPISAADHAAEWQKWRDARAKFLVTPGRPQSYTGLTWIHDGAVTIGGDSSNAVVLKGSNVPAHLGTLTRSGRRVRFEPLPGVAVTIDSLPAVAGWLRTDGDSGGASRVNVGSAGFRILRRVDSIGVRMWDADLASPEAIAKSLAPLEYFPLQPEWRLPGRFTRAARPETLAVPTVTGVREEYIYVGRVKARVGGTRVDLTAFATSKKNDLYFSFSDETGGEETYGFRFLHAALDTLTNIVTLDFNQAYNPDCAFSKFTTCPLPPDGNRIGVRIPAGEKVARHLDEIRAAGQ